MATLLFFDQDHRYTLGGEDLPSVTHICRFLAYDYKSAQPWLAEAAARRGTAVHEVCALIDYGEEPEVSPEIEGYITAYRRFLKDYQPEWEGIETPLFVCDDWYKFAGTPDRWGQMGGKFTLLDIKTGAVHVPYVSAQLCGYSVMLLAGGRKVQSSYALRLDKSGVYELIPIEPNVFLLDSCIILDNATKGRKP